MSDSTQIDQIPGLPDALQAPFARLAPDIRDRLLRIRELIFETAAQSSEIGTITETLKWGEPAYLTEATKSGTTIRLGVAKPDPDCAAIFVNCQTSLIDEFRDRFADVFRFQKSRALIIPKTAPLPEAPLSICLHAALTYHLRRRTRTK